MSSEDRRLQWQSKTELFSPERAVSIWPCGLTEISLSWWWCHTMVWWCHTIVMVSLYGVMVMVWWWARGVTGGGSCLTVAVSALLLPVSSWHQTAAQHMTARAPQHQSPGNWFYILYIIYRYYMYNISPTAQHMTTRANQHQQATFWILKDIENAWQLNLIK